MSVETQHSDDSSTDIENYEWFTAECGTVHYKTDKHHIGVTEDYETNYLYINEYVENATDSSVRFSDVMYKEYNDSNLSPAFQFSHNDETTLSIDQADVSIEFEELLFEVLINE